MWLDSWGCLPGSPVLLPLLFAPPLRKPVAAGIDASAVSFDGLVSRPEGDGNHGQGRTKSLREPWELPRHALLNYNAAAFEDAGDEAGA